MESYALAAMDPRTDKDRLTGAAYGTSQPLRQRIRLYDFAVHQMDLREWVLDQLSLPRDATVLDVGCGPGMYLRATRNRSSDARVFGCDISFGMAGEASRHAPTIVADATMLPVPSASVDVLIAAHMLYHVGDIDAALGEFSRCIAAGGTAAIVLNGDRHLIEIFELLRQAVAQAGGIAPVPERTFERARLLNSRPLVERHFQHVTIREFGDDIIVSDADVVVDYIASMESLYGPIVDAVWPDVLAATRAIVEGHISRHGTWNTSNHGGVILASNP